MKKLERDLHSVYIDNEMPKDFISDYEEALSKSAESKADLEKMQKIHALFQKDAGDIEVSDKFVEESFARLQMKMRFSQTAHTAERTSFVTRMKLPASFAAAAAVFALIFTPAFVRSSSKAEEEVTAISVAVSDDIPAISDKDVVIDGTINSGKLAEFAVSNAVADAEAKEVQPTTVLSTKLVEQKVVQASALVSNSNSFRKSMTSVDMFRPELNTMNVTVPEFGEISNFEN